MKKYIYIPLFILLSLSLTNCQNSNTTGLEATNAALSNQVNTLMTQLTQQASSASQGSQIPLKKSTESTLSTASPVVSPSPISSGGSSGLAPALIVSGSGTITPWSNKTVYPNTLFGAANVHLICAQTDTTRGVIWIDDKTYTAGCDPNSESWSLWKQDITVGDHYIYSQNSNDKYEFWTMGSTPFIIRNKYESSDFMFVINNPGIYNLTANLIKGEFDLYISCEKAQNFNYKINQSTTIQVVLNPARCELIVRDSPPGTVNPGEIEVSLEFSK